MDSHEHTESETPASTPETDLQHPPYRSPLIVRGLVFAFLIVVVVSIYNGHLFKPAAPAHTFKDDLQKLGLSYHEYHRARGSSPASLELLQEFNENPPPPPKSDGIVPPDPVTVVALPSSVVKLIEEGGIVVIWGAQLTDSGQENDKFLLAYTKDIADNGGFALTAAGRVLELTPDEFKAYPLIPSESDEPGEPAESETASEKAKSGEQTDKQPKASAEQQPEKE